MEKVEAQELKITEVTSFSSKLTTLINESEKIARQVNKLSGKAGAASDTEQLKAVVVGLGMQSEHLAKQVADLGTELQAFIMKLYKIKK